MTVSSDIGRSGPYLGNGVTTVFEYEFRILAASHLKVILRSALDAETVLLVDVDYTVQDVGQPGGGQITLALPPAAGETITILRAVPFTQETDLENQGAFFAETIEAALDQAAMRDQQMAEEIARSVKIPASGDVSEIDVLIANVQTIAGMSDDVQTVASNIGEIDNVATNMAAVQNVSTNMPKVSTVALISGDVQQVADIAPAVEDVSDNMAAVLSAQTNLAAIQAAPAAAAQAAAVAATIGNASTIVVTPTVRGASDVQSALQAIATSPVSPKTAGYTVVAADVGKIIALTAATASETFNLPALSAVAEGAPYQFKNLSASTLMVLDPNGSETIEGGSTFVITPGQGGTIAKMGSGWRFVGAAPAQFYESSAIPIVAGGQAVVSTVFKPHRIELLLVCTVAQSGYSVGDVVAVSPTFSIASAGSNLTRGAAALLRDADAIVVFGEGVFNIPHRTTGAFFNATSANWTVVLRAWGKY